MSSSSQYSKASTGDDTKRPVYDFRSDTVTVPTPAMKEAMMAALVGDDVYGEDPTVIELETKVAALCGKEAAMFCASGTMTNQIGLRLHLAPLQEVICDANSHIHQWESGGLHYHTGAAIKPIVHEGHHLTAELIESNIVTDHSLYHKPITRVIELENTLNGKIFPMDELSKIASVAKKYDLRMHLDGARLWNACTATGNTPAQYCAFFDTVSVCLSKGLGAPIGSLLVGSRSHINQARHFRKIFGGGWRQAGILAAAGIFALDNHFKKLADDHANAAHLGTKLKSLGFALANPIETNMVFVDSKATGVPMETFAEELKAKYGIVIAAPAKTAANPFVSRLVVHHQTPREAIDLLVGGIEEVLNKKE
eukprot:TRINITY_DN1432_c2_g1_i1.p1 TRINITY_DN1432_c2_g1~~TRINITY_DN1432_c2_g1_i1.p1  ORF type:complete len:390 (-),score=95.48 TRINITY_DN1432_c2_g1_i1:31-1131(-)